MSPSGRERPAPSGLVRHGRLTLPIAATLVRPYLYGAALALHLRERVPCSPPCPAPFLPQATAGREPLLELAGRHLLSWFLNDCGHSTRALDELHRAAPLYRLCRDTEPHLLRPWLEARICRGLGELAAAERGLVAVWHDFHMAGFARDLTLVSLDLADTYLAQAKPRHALRLLKTFHTTLAHLQMHPEGMAAWLLLIQAAAGETAAAQALTRRAALYFRRAWKRPMPFAPGTP